MSASTPLDEARRWTKFPATLLFVTGLLWLLVAMFQAAADWDEIAQRSETFLGAAGLFLLMVVVPLGCPLAAIGSLYLQRQALYTGAALPFIPLVALSLDKAARIGDKFRQFRSVGSIGSFGDGVIDAVIVLGLWLVFAVHVYYVARALHELAKAQQWQQGKPRGVPQLAVGTAPGSPPLPSAAGEPGEDTCFLLPEAQAADDDD